MASVKSTPLVRIPVKYVIQCQVGLLKSKGSVMEFKSYKAARIKAVSRAKKTGRQYGIMRTEYVARNTDSAGTPKDSRRNTKLATPLGLTKATVAKKYNTDKAARSVRPASRW